MLDWPEQMPEQLVRLSSKVLKAPKESDIFPIISRKHSQDADCAAHVTDHATVDASTLTFEVRWTPRDMVSDATYTQDYVGRSPPDGLLRTGEGPGSEPGVVVLGSDKIVSIPETNGNYTMWLLVDDSAGGAALESEYKSANVSVEESWDQMVVAQWNFEVAGKLPFEVTSFTRSTDGEYADFDYLSSTELGELDCAVGETYKIAPITDVKTKHKAKGGNIEYTYVLKGAPKGFFTDSSNGEVLAVPTAPTGAGNNGELVVAQLFAVDASGEEALVQKISISVRTKDLPPCAYEPEFDNRTCIINDAYGPGGRGCGAHGTPIDKNREDWFDKAFDCSCIGGSGFTGSNCDVPPEPSKTTQDEDSDAATAVSIGVAGGLISLFVVGMIISKVRERRVKMKPLDFMQQYRDMVASGEIHPENVDDDAKSKLPREIKRSHLTLVEVVGKGQFGQVWKAVLDESSTGGLPGYLVAAKTVLNSKVSLEASKELESEALVMAQVDHHPNLVSLVGVVTRGDPLILIVGYCEHGSLLEMLRVRAKESDPLSLPLKLRLCLDAAKGMNHLVKQHFIHRDLAARNVLVATGNVGKVADFGLSRGTNLRKMGGTAGEDGDDDAAAEDEDGSGDYYRSQAGVFPIRWTAPEAMETLKFSAASDCWSFAIVMVEVLQDGAAPYTELKNAAVMQKVMAGYKHPRPPDCSASLYGMLCECWDPDPKNRPQFSRIVQVLDFNCKKVGANDLPSVTTIQKGGVSVKHIQRMRSTGSLSTTSAASATIAETAFDGGRTDSLASTTAAAEDQPHAESAYEYQGAVNIVLQMAGHANEPCDGTGGGGGGGGSGLAAAVPAADDDGAYEMPDGFNHAGVRKGGSPAAESGSTTGGSGAGGVGGVDSDSSINIGTGTATAAPLRPADRDSLLVGEGSGLAVDDEYILVRQHGDETSDVDSDDYSC